LHNSKSHRLLTKILLAHIILLPYLLQLLPLKINLLELSPNKITFHDKLNQ
jgi:hypothetical protein